MKNFSKIFFGLSAAALMTACSQEEVSNPAAAGDITVSVATDTEISSRALATIDGYELKCVMQLLDDNGITMDEQAISGTTDGKAQFTIKGEQLDAGASKALFWAEYVPTAGASKVYDSSDLTKVSYAVTDFDMSNTDLMAAADAFAGSITTLANGASVTLSRPMIKFNFTPTNPEVATGATSLEVAFATPTDYNVLSGACNGTPQNLKYTNAAFNPAAGAWFSGLILAPANLAKLDSPITLTLGGGVSAVNTIAANTIPLDANYIVNGSAEISVGGDQTLDVDVDVTINGGFENEPKPAEFTVGTYVNAAGEPTNEKAEAVGVIFKVGAIDGDDATLYPAEFAGKTIKGYVVATENVLAKRATVNAALIPDGLTPSESLINGSIDGAEVLAAFGESDFVKGWNAWTAAHTLTANGNHTAWYLPAQPQMQAWISMLYPTTDLKGQLVDAETSDAFKALFPESNIFDTDPIRAVLYAGSSINRNGNIMGTNIEVKEGVVSVRFSQINIVGSQPQALGRAMFTVFE